MKGIQTRWWPVLAAAVAVAVVIAVVASMSLAGSGPRADRAPRAAQPTPTTLTPGDATSLTRHVKCAAPTPGEVSAGQLKAFHAVTAVSCVQDIRNLAGQGRWLVSVRRVATAGVPALQAAFERPDAKPSNGFCPAMAYLPLPLVLVDGSGHTLAPSPPLGSCHLPQQAYFRALDHVTWQTVSVHKIRQTVAPQVTN